MIKEYPALVYKDEGAHPRHGGTYDLKSIADDSELADAIEAGWYETLPEAIAKEAPSVKAVVKPDSVKRKVKAQDDDKLDTASSWGN